MAFLENSTINLGRKGTKTRQQFMQMARQKLDFYALGGFDKSDFKDCNDKPDDTSQPTTNSMDDRIVCIKPKDSRKVLDVGKGVHAMTPSESMRADEQLNRSPFAGKTKNKE